ncbi:SLC18B1 [Bugula neritina]|uniref:SLC18B1 n=1 Tax=Bugula neritina TaxID=10212 RepID=A0A7J7KBN2_BUGNE|nr:SLC18B1 [Bugula neritina]
MYLAQAVASGIIAPFYPSEAAKKGANSTVVGLVFGVYQLVIFVTSPIYGSIIQNVGAKYMYLSGSFLLGGCGLAFGFLDRAPDGPVYIAMCFICRSIEANGAAMMITAAFSIMAATFPHDIGKAIGILETFYGIGLVLGPAIGGGLYSIGGFLLPFEVIGGFVWCCSIVSYFTLPKIEEVQQLNVNIFTLLKIPGCSVLYISMVSCGMSLCYLDPIFSPYMKATFPQLSIPQIGLMFAVTAVTYAIIAPLIGYISDKGLQGSLAVIGSVIMTIALLLFGPNPWLETFIPTSIPETVVALILFGVGASGLMIPLFPLLHRMARSGGLPDNLQTFGLVSGLFTSGFSLGAFLGPTLAGYLVNQYEFAWACSVCGLIVIFNAYVQYCLKITISMCYDRFLDRAPDGPVYIAMCFICRSIEANGAAMMMTAAFLLWQQLSHMMSAKQ